METSFSASLLGALVNSFHGIARSLGVSKTETIAHGATDEARANTGERKKLQLVKHTRSDRIDFNPNSLGKVQRIVSSSMRFYSTNAKHGDIFKSHDKLVTVTVYASTSSIHVQGTNYRRWTNEFIEQFAKADDDQEHGNSENRSVDNSETSLKELFQPNPHMTSTPHSKTDSFDRHILHENPTSLEDTVAALCEEIGLLRTRLANLEIPASKVSTCTVSTQTGKTGRSDMQTMTECMSNTSRHVQCSIVIESQTNIITDTPNIIGQSNLTISEPVPETSNRQQVSLTPQTTFSDSHIQTPGPQAAPSVLHDEPPTGPNLLESNDTATQNGIPRSSTFIIGSSIVQGIRPRGLQNVKVKTLRGAQLQRIGQYLNNARLDNIGNLIIQAGGNDVSSGRTLAQIETDLSRIIRDVQLREPNIKIFVSEVLPRVDIEDISGVNSTYKSVCSELGATVIESTKYIPKVSEMHYWDDDIHLTKAGTAKLIKAYNEYTPVLRPKSELPSQSCFFCGEIGHNSTKCRHGSKLQCYTCGNFGHKSKFCVWNKYPWMY